MEFLLYRNFIKGIKIGNLVCTKVRTKKGLYKLEGESILENEVHHIQVDIRNTQRILL